MTRLFAVVLLTTIITFFPAICAGEENDSARTQSAEVEPESDGKFEWTWPSHLSYPNELSSQFWKADSSFIMEREVKNGEQVEQTLIMWVGSTMHRIPITTSETDPLYLLWGKSASDLKPSDINVIKSAYDSLRQSH